MSDPLNPDEINDLADRWYKALDVHAPVEELYAMLLDDGNVMEWPEGPTYGHETSVIVDYPFVTGRSTSDSYLTGQKMVEVMENGLRQWGFHPSAVGAAS